MKWIGIILFQILLACTLPPIILRTEPGFVFGLLVLIPILLGFALIILAIKYDKRKEDEDGE